MRLQLRLTSAATQLIVHCLIVFGLAFAGQLTAGVTGVVSMPTLLALLTSAAAAGLTAVVHYALGLVPNPPVVTARGKALGAAVSLKIPSRVWQVIVSVVVTFLTIFLSALVAGATHVTSLPTAVDLLTAAITAAVTGVVQYVTGLIPTPPATPNARHAP